MAKQRNSHSRKVVRQSGGQVRIIAGRWRGRKLNFPVAPGLRPTGDRVRETLFNWLQPSLSGARCLDLYAGSGALGLEAASRGAGEVIMIEGNAQVCAALQRQIAKLEANQVQAIHSSAEHWLKGDSMTGAFDIVFLDPPFDHLTSLSTTLRNLANSAMLAEDAVIYIESSSAQGSPVSDISCLTLNKEKVFGGVTARLYRYHHKD